MADTVAPEYVRFVASARRDKQLPAAPTAMAAGDVSHPVFVDAGQATELLRVAARRAVGLFRPTKRTEVVWVHGDNELAVSLVDIRVKVADGLIHVLLPVRCDQIGKGVVEVFFAVGAPNDPAGLYASTLRRPNGPPLVVGVWGEALTAFAWQCVLGLVSGIAGATGKDARGNVLVPAELVATTRGIQIVPMARHRFAGSTGLKTTTKTAVIG
jgi:hypothetical protein